MKILKNTYRGIALPAILFLWLGIITGCHNMIKPEGHIEISEQATDFDADTSADPFPFKVRVYKTDFMGPAYRVTYNYLSNDTVRPGGAIYGSKAIYDMAYYKWTDDTTVSIRLYNSETEEYEEFYVFGMPSCKGSGMGGWNEDEDAVTKE